MNRLRLFLLLLLSSSTTNSIASPSSLNAKGPPNKIIDGIVRPVPRPSGVCVFGQETPLLTFGYTLTKKKRANTTTKKTTVKSFLRRLLSQEKKDALSLSLKRENVMARELERRIADDNKHAPHQRKPALSIQSSSNIDCGGDYSIMDELFGWILRKWRKKPTNATAYTFEVSAATIGDEEYKRIREPAFLDALEKRIVTVLDNLKNESSSVVDMQIVYPTPVMEHLTLKYKIEFDEARIPTSPLFSPAATGKNHWLMAGTKMDIASSRHKDYYSQRQDDLGRLKREAMFLLSDAAELRVLQTSLVRCSAGWGWGGSDEKERSLTLNLSVNNIQPYKWAPDKLAMMARKLENNETVSEKEAFKALVVSNRTVSEAEALEAFREAILEESRMPYNDWFNVMVLPTRSGLKLKLEVEEGGTLPWWLQIELEKQQKHNICNRVVNLLQSCESDALVSYGLKFGRETISTGGSSDGSPFDLIVLSSRRISRHDRRRNTTKHGSPDDHRVLSIKEARRVAQNAIESAAAEYEWFNVTFLNDAV